MRKGKITQVIGAVVDVKFKGEFLDGKLREPKLRDDLHLTAIAAAIARLRRIPPEGIISSAPPPQTLPV